MDINLLRSRLQSLQNPKGAGKGDLPKTLWSPTVGKHAVRILPSAYDKSNPFKELMFHYGIGNKTMIALTNFGEKDPIVEFTQGLRKSSEKDNWQLAKKLEPKMRIFVPVIVRGEEDKGVMLWGFGKQIYMELLSLLEDEDVGDYTDPLQGRDITIETLGKDTTGKEYNTSTVRVRTKITPLSDDADKVKTWLTTQPDPVAQFKKFAYEDMKSALLSHLNPDDDASATSPAPVQSAPAEVGDLPWEKPADKFSLSTTKTDINSKIDDLFDF